MAQDGFILSDEGRNISCLNDSGTTAIDAGDLVFCEANNDVLTGTAASARNGYEGSAVKVKTMVGSATGYANVVGVAIEDIPADGYGAVALEGVFIHAVAEDTEAGDLLQGYEGTANKVQILDVATTTSNQAWLKQHIGRALTGGSADGKYIVWKLGL